MPELPDVEHVRRRLDRWLRGTRIVAARAADRNIYRASPQSFARKLVGRTVEAVGRKGKWLRIVLDDELRIFAHLGMTGDFNRADAGDTDAPARFERARLEVASAPKKGNKRRKGETSIVRYVDARRWGRIIVSGEDIAAWNALGPDPLADGVDVAELEKKLARRKRRSIKEVLLDQSVLAGVGNILATEALWKAQIDPRTRAARLDDKDIRSLARGIDWAIARHLDYLERGDAGEDDPFKVYGRKDEPCPRCGAPLTRIVLGGRTTTFCTGCQKRR